MELVQRGAMDLAGAISRRELSAREVVGAHIDRIRKVNPIINAVVNQRFDAALAEAATADERQAKGETLGPLHGVPFTVKEEIQLGGYPCTLASWYRRDLKAVRDATVVARLKAAGGIVLGQTNMSEMALWIECENTIYGTTDNPYKAGHTPGGSSGGDGSIVGAGGVPFSVGADGAGSARVPAAFCGTFSHKPTAATVPMTGHYPMLEGIDWEPLSAWSLYFSICTLTRRADDLLPLLRLIVGGDGIDRECRPLDLPDLPSGWRPSKVLICEDPHILFGRRPAPAIQSAILRAGQSLAGRGAPLEHFAHRAFRDAIQIWGAYVTECGGPGVNDIFGGGSPPSLIAEAWRWARGTPRHSAPAFVLSLAERLFKPSPKSMRKLRIRGQELDDALRAALGPDGVMIMPVFPSTAPRHKGTLPHFLEVGTTGIFNALGYPVSIVPMGLDAKGLPVGIQIVGAPNRDVVTLEVARMLEKDFGGWSPPGRLPA